MENPGIGHNNPSLVEHGLDTVKALNEWTNEHPVIQSEEEAREGKLLVDRAKLCAKDMDVERRQRQQPHTEEIEKIRTEYREPQSLLEKACAELTRRLNAYVETERINREKAAQEARKAAEEAAKRAAEVIETERRAREEADSGVLDANVVDAVADTEVAVKMAEKAERIAARAERDTKVKVGGGFRRALSQRNIETLVVEDASAALQALGVTDHIREAILTSARKYREVIGELPDGVSATYERTL